MGKNKSTPMTPEVARRMQSSFDKKIAEQPPPKLDEGLQAAKSRVMSAAYKEDSK